MFNPRAKDMKMFDSNARYSKKVIVTWYIVATTCIAVAIFTGGAMDEAKMKGWEIGFVLSAIYSASVMFGSLAIFCALVVSGAVRPPRRT